MDTLVMSSWTAGRTTLRELTEACVAAGIPAIALVHVQYDRFRANGETDADMAEALRASGVRVVDVEGVSGILRPDPARSWSAHAERLFGLAEVLGAENVLCVSDHDGDLAAASVRLAHFCDAAADRGLGVLLEPVPAGGMLDPGTAWQLVERTERTNVGLVLDTWHFFRGGETPATIGALPAQAFRRVQVSDGPRRPAPGMSYATETRHHRLLPGGGEFDLVGVVHALEDAGADPVWSIEVLSDALDELPGSEAARRAADATRALLQEARRR